MAIPISYNLRNLKVRKTTTIMTALGIALTVAVLLAVMALVEGLRSAFKTTAHPLNVLVMRKGSNSELSSNFSRQQYQDIKFKSGIARNPAGEPLVSLEMVTVIVLESPAKGTGSNITLRGVTPLGLELRDGLKLEQGRWFTPGRREAVIGKSLVGAYPETHVGGKLKFGRGDWDIVGVISQGNSAVNSEIWVDLNQVSADFERSSVLSSALVRGVDEPGVTALINSLKDDQKLNVDARTEKTYYEEQMITAAPVQFLGTFIAIIMAVGSCFAAMNTMYAAVARRAREVGTLRVLGFSRGGILLSFFIESLLLSILGGLLGIALVLPLNNVTAAMGNFITFSETSFNFRVTPAIMTIGLGFAIVLGAAGGIFPARSAARKEILTALREM
jgi:putative ABC transport system permease protein